MPDEPFTTADIDGLEEAPVVARFASSQVLSVRLSDSELRTLAYAAREAGLKVSTYVKRAALREAAPGTALPLVTPQHGLTLVGIVYQSQALVRAEPSANAAREVTGALVISVA